MLRYFTSIVAQRIGQSITVSTDRVANVLFKSIILARATFENICRAGIDYKQHRLKVSCNSDLKGPSGRDDINPWTSPGCGGSTIAANTWTPP